MELLKNNIIVNFQVLQETSTSSETLHVIDSCQYQEGGLFHTSDPTCTFFLKLEQEHVDRINPNKLAGLQCDMVDNSIEQVAKSSVLLNNFTDIFKDERDLNNVRKTFYNAI